MCVGKEVCTVLFSETCFKVLHFWFSCSLRLARNGFWLFLFDLAAIVSLTTSTSRIWISVARVFASGVGFVCLCPGWCVEVAGGGWRECVC